MGPKDSFDAKAASWDDDPMRRERARTVARAIAEIVPLHAGMRVLDFGSGTGLLGRALLPEVKKVVFADPSEGMRRELHRRLDEMGALDRGEVVDPEELGEAGDYDLVASLMTLHHLPDVPASIARLAGLLQTGGWLALSDLDREDGSFHTEDSGPVHHGFDRPELSELMRARGLTPTADRTAFTIEKIVEGRRREYPVFLLVARKD